MAIDNMVRKLPFSLEAEQSVLGAILIDPEALNEIATIIGVEDFYLKEHQEIYSAMQKLFLQSRTIDPVTLMNALVQEGVYNSEESKNYLRTIAETVPNSSNVRDYANIVRDKSLLRQLIEITGEIAEDAYAEQDSASDIINLAESKVFRIAQTKEQHDFSHIKEILLSTYKHIKEVADNPEAAAGTPTGFSGLDNILVGMGKSDMIVVGARPGMGKTSFALNVAVNVAKQTKKAVCVFSLEMSKEQLVSRVLSSEAQIESNTLRSGMLSQDDWENLARASSFLSETDIYIDDTSNITVTGMKSKLRRVKNLGLVVIDYLGLMQSDRRIDNRVQEVTDITRNVKIMARELMVPIICCAQLNRENTARKDTRPQLSDLRDSGSIEQDADVVLFLHRDDYYDQDPENQNRAEIIIAKNRHGGTGKVDVNFFGKYTKFSTPDMRDEHG